MKGKSKQKKNQNNDADEMDCEKKKGFTQISIRIIDVDYKDYYSRKENKT